MNTLYLTTEDTWAQHNEFARAVSWQTASGEESIVFEAQVDSSHWQIRLNDFPEEPAYTLFVAKIGRVHFEDWPSFWKRPAFPKRVERRDA